MFRTPQAEDAGHAMSSGKILHWLDAAARLVSLELVSAKLKSEISLRDNDVKFARTESVSCKVSAGKEKPVLTKAAAGAMFDVVAAVRESNLIERLKTSDKWEQGLRRKSETDQWLHFQ